MSITRVIARQLVALLVAIGLFAVALACGSKSTTAPSTTSSAPQVTACSTATYQGASYSLTCGQGVASYQATITQAGRTVCFNVTCSAGCLSSVRTC